MIVSIFDGLGKLKNQIITQRQLIGYAKSKADKEIDSLVPFIEGDTIEKLYYLINGLSKLEKCPYCDNKKKWSGRLTQGYYNTCGNKECLAKFYSEANTEHNIKAKENCSSNYEAAINNFNIESPKDINDDFIKTILLNKRGIIHSRIPLLSKDIKSYLENRFDDSSSIEETISRIGNGIERKPVCPICGKPVTYIGKPSKMFSTYCSYTCAANSEETNKKKQLKRKSL